MTMPMSRRRAPSSGLPLAVDETSQSSVEEQGFPHSINWSYTYSSDEDSLRRSLSDPSLNDDIESPFVQSDRFAEPFHSAARRRTRSNALTLPVHDETHEPVHPVRSTHGTPTRVLLALFLLCAYTTFLPDPEEPLELPRFHQPAASTKVQTGPLFYARGANDMPLEGYYRQFHHVHESSWFYINIAAMLVVAAWMIAEQRRNATCRL